MIQKSILLLLFCYVGATSAMNATFTPEEFGKFRTGETKTLTISIIETDEGLMYEGVRSVAIKCVDESICEIVSPPLEVELNKENNFSATFNITVKATFLGITNIDVRIDAEHLTPFGVRILRSADDHRVTIAFTIFIAIFVVCITFMMGTQLELKRIANIARTPIGPLTGFFCQFGLMPTLGFLLAEYCLPDDNISLKLALFAVSTCPGGGKSSFWTIIFGGNLDLSISMTFTQTIAALFMMPLWMSTAGRHFTDRHVQIPFAKIIQGLAAIVVPTCFGILFNHYKPEHAATIQRWIKRASWVAMIVITIFAIYTNYYMIYLITWPIVFCGCALPWLGYITAFMVAYICRQSFKDCLTIAIETGIQNIGIAMLLMMWCLPEPESDISITVIFVVAIMTDKPLVIIWLVSRIYKRCSKKDAISQGDAEKGVKPQLGDEKGQDCVQKEESPEKTQK